MGQRYLDAAPILLACLLSVFLSASAFADERDRTIFQFQHTAWTAKVGDPGGIQALAQTRDGYLWLGTSNGLYRFDSVSFERFDPVAGPAFPSRGVLSLLALPNGDLWTGFRAGGVSLLRDGGNTNYGASEGLPQGRVWSLAQDSEGAIWAGTDGGLARFEQGRWKKVADDWNYPGKSAQGIYLDRQGTLWVATESTIVFLPARARRFQTTGTHVGSVCRFTRRDAMDG
jgi:ligand-binding sensor domain-containing protein